MKVAFVQRGLAYYVSEISSAIARAGHDVLFVHREENEDFTGSGGPDKNAEYRELFDPRMKLRFVSIKDRNFLAGMPHHLRAVAEMKWVIHRFRPDLIHLQDETDYRIFAAVSLPFPRVPIVVTVHDAALHPGYKPSRTAFIRQWLRNIAAQIIVHGEEIKRQLVSQGIPDDKVNICPLGAHVFTRRWITGDTEGSDRNVLFFGRILEYKGLDYLIKAAPLVWEKVPQARFVIAGQGPDWPRCKALITNPEGFIIRHENIPDPEVTRLFEQAAVVVLPYVEGSGSGVLSIAIALGKPAIVTNVGSLPEYIDQWKTGVVVPPRDEKALAEAIIRLLSDDQLRESIGKNAYRMATDGELSWDRIAQKTIKVYEKALRMKPT